MGILVDLKVVHSEQEIRAELRASYPPQAPVHIYESGSKWLRLSKGALFHGSSLILIYSIAAFCLKKLSRNYLAPLSFPKIVVVVASLLGLYNILHIIAGWHIHLASYPSGYKERIDGLREQFYSDDRVVRRVSVQANGNLIDALIVAKPGTLVNRRWMIFSNGNNEGYESRGEDYITLAEKLNANVILYNYAFTGRSGGLLPNRKAVRASHEAILSFAEKELNAKEIIDYAYSIGGGVQGDRLNHYPFKDDVKYVFVKHKTFATLSHLLGDKSALLGLAIRCVNWNYSPALSSKELTHPEVIFQKGRSNYQIMTNTDQIENDATIIAQRSLAKALFDDSECPRDKKTFVTVTGTHMDPIVNHESYAKFIKAQLVLS